MRGITQGLEPTTAVRIILEQRAVFGRGAGIPEIYAASLKLEGELPIVRRLLCITVEVIDTALLALIETEESGSGSDQSGSRNKCFGAIILQDQISRGWEDAINLLDCSVDHIRHSLVCSGGCWAWAVASWEYGCELIWTLLFYRKTFKGNRPSLSLLLPTLSAYEVGQDFVLIWGINSYYTLQLLSIYEHRIAVQGFLWGINSFDQWGVELGKPVKSTVTICGDIDGQFHDLAELIRIAQNQSKQYMGCSDFMLKSGGLSRLFDIITAFDFVECKETKGCD
ncbi:Glucose-6-phosphate isomerase, cytosolic [Zea mays]|uniref:glucose-6-phosphate isomerase n=1 Tax=Zea mays TaxID=4577 RepID=A0A3L6EQJ0_MAIZE|nr:Glucose-6-phosphate isomerase, cytosolic [Zea mays]